MKCDKKIESQISIPNGVKIEKKEQFLIFSGVLGFTKLDLTKIDPMGLGGIRISKDEKSVILFIVLDELSSSATEIVVLCVENRNIIF